MKIDKKVFIELKQSIPKIIAKAKKNYLSNIRICKPIFIHQESKLNFLVDIISEYEEEINHGNIGGFQLYLNKCLSCETEVEVFEFISEPFKKEIIANLVPLNPEGIDSLKTTYDQLYSQEEANPQNHIRRFLV